MMKNLERVWATDEKVDMFFKDFPEFAETGHDRTITDNYINALYCAKGHGYDLGCEECPFCTTCELYDNAMREYLAK